MNPTTNSHVEYELTFLAREIPIELKQAMPERVVDVYVPEDHEVHPHLRLRKRGSSYEITKKTLISAEDHSAQLEQTLPLDRSEFESLASGHSRMVEKDRYAISIGGVPAEVDIFSGKLEGLVLIDFEFESEAAKATFVPPLCCLADVTQEEFIAGGRLAGKGYDDIAEALAHFGYQPLSM